MGRAGPLGGMKTPTALRPWRHCVQTHKGATGGSPWSAFAAKACDP